MTKFEKMAQELEHMAGKVGSPSGDIKAVMHQAAMMLREMDAAETKVRADERAKCAKTKAGKPRKFPTKGRGLLYFEQYCFELGYKEGSAAVRKAIREGSSS